MGFSIGGLLKDVGINLPKIDLGNIGKTVLDEGKKLLGEVVKDSFTLSNKPGETFADDMNLSILGENVRLPNPIGRLANKLLGGVDSKLNDFGVNVDFKTVLGKLLHLPTEQGDVAVPPIKQRLAPQAANRSAPGAAATGGGAVAQSFATAGSSGAAATGGASATTGGFADESVVNAMGTASGNLDSLINSINDKMSPAELAKVQAKIQQAQELMNTLSTILKDEHEMRMAIIGNMRS